VNIIEFVLLFIMAFFPPFIYTLWIRNIEKYNKEKWKPILLCFIWGATIAIIAALIIEVILQLSLIPSIENPTSLGFITVVLIAPFAEELTKPFALRLKIVKKELEELEDGLIYGAVAGLGFSATENLLYGWGFLSEGLLFFFIFISIRSFGGCLLHASATAWTGYGYGKTIISNTKLIKVLPYFILAILVHAFYNAILSLDFLGAVIGLSAALLFTAVTITIVKNKIIKLDRINR